MDTTLHSPRLAITAGEPAGIGPDLIALLAQTPSPAQRVVLGDRDQIEARAAALGLPLVCKTFDPDAPRRPSPVGVLDILSVPLPKPAQPGLLDPENASQVIRLLEQAADGCLDGCFDAMVTAPVHKAIINQAGIAFTGHTEWLAQRAGVAQTVMLLVAERLRVAMVTTHLPLQAVPAAITARRILRILTILHTGLRQDFGLSSPRIAVCGLNPHAGENGVLGSEELEVIIPALDSARAQGLQVLGPLPADTAFTPRSLAQCDAVLTMYHDQGLPVLKHVGFGHAVNVTLGLPFIRTSVDHGTALDRAGGPEIDVGSLQAAESLAMTLVQQRSHHANV